MNLENHCRSVSKDKINKAIEKEQSHFQKLLLESCHSASGDTSQSECLALVNRLDSFLEYYLPSFIRADFSAQHFQAAYSRASTAVFTFGVLAVIIVTAQHLFHWPHFLVWGEVFCIGLILLIFHGGNHRRWHRNWVDCRYFAERVRCGFFVAFLCGKSAVHETQQWSDQLVDGAWCNPKFQKFMRDRPHPGLLKDDHLEVLRHFMVNHWFVVQESHHRSNTKRKMRKHKIVSRIGEAFFWVTLVTAFLHLTPHHWRHALHVDHILTDNLLTFIVIVLPAIGTALAGVRGHFDFKKTATRSRMIANQLEDLIREARQAEDLAELSLVVLRAEEIMIQENSGWHLNSSGKVIPSE